MSKSRTFHLSATSISAFKACPTRFRLGYREGLRVAEDTESQRIGTNWHSLHEVYQQAYQKALTVLTPICGGQGTEHTPTDIEDIEAAKDAAISAAIEHLNQRYANTSPPASKTVEEWDVERLTLVTCFTAYQWYWQNDPVDLLASEVAFDLPLQAPRTMLPLPVSEVLRVGKIDHIIRWQNMIGNMERKSTTRSIDPSGDYWDKAKKDTQVSMYALAFRDLLEGGHLHKFGPIPLHEGEDMPSIGNTLYDVWHRPTIKPAKLTQADTTTLIETGVYYGQKFNVLVGEVTAATTDTAHMPGDPYVTVDESEAEVFPGKKGFAIRETPALYAARLLHDIAERPEFYFQRKEIARTDQELRQFRVELFNIYQAQRLYDRTGCWFENEQQCRATFPCPFIPICYGPGAENVCDGETTPSGFKRIFNDQTVSTTAVEEGD